MCSQRPKLSNHEAMVGGHTAHWVSGSLLLDAVLCSRHRKVGTGSRDRTVQHHWTRTCPLPFTRDTRFLSPYSLLRRSPRSLGSCWTPSPPLSQSAPRCSGSWLCSASAASRDHSTASRTCTASCEKWKLHSRSSRTRCWGRTGLRRYECQGRCRACASIMCLTDSYYHHVCLHTHRGVF